MKKLLSGQIKNFNTTTFRLAFKPTILRSFNAISAMIFSLNFTKIDASQLSHKSGTVERRTVNLKLITSEIKKIRLAFVERETSFFWINWHQSILTHFKVYQHLDFEDNFTFYSNLPISCSEYSNLLFLISAVEMIWTISATTMEHFIMLHIIRMKPL